MAQAWQMGNFDWETELTCSICTDVLYQPLTLLNCLHTFCGSCLKEWFAQQASTATSAHPYTCPACRAHVQSTTKHAWINTILEQYMLAHPDKGKTAQEKEDIRKTYKPGDNVMPKLRRRRRPEEEGDRQLMDEVRALSLRDAGSAQGPVATLGPPRQRERTSRSRSNDRNRQQHRSRESSGNGAESFARPPRITASTLAGPPTARQVHHQSSLRSLLSASELDSEEMEEALLRQVVEEGLLDGIDLENISRPQEEQIQERLSEAFHRLRRERGEGRQGERRSTSPAHGQSRARAGTEEPTPSGPAPQPQSSRPPVSRPHLLNAGNETTRTNRRRTSSQGSSQSTRMDSNDGLALPSSTGDRASRSVSDLSLEPPSAAGSGERPRRASANSRRTTDPTELRQELSHVRASQGIADRRTNSNPTSPVPTPGQFQPTEPRQHSTFPVSASSRTAARNSPGLTSAVPAVSTPSQPSATRDTATGAPTTQQERPSVYYEPSISCDRCNKPNIQYSVHFACSKCKNGAYHLCQLCYRKGEGCLHWYGFTPELADAKFARAAPSLHPAQRSEPPHILVGHRYNRPKQPLVRSLSQGVARMASDEDPSKRLQAGVFCDSCGNFANDCYWKCDICNDGAWGFCNSCVNQLKHCTHPLLPLTHRTATANKGTPNQIGHPQTQQETIHSNSLVPAHQSSPPLTPNYFGEHPLTEEGIFIATLEFHPYSFNTACDICGNPILPSQSRFHCPECNNGDYDICNSCYPMQVSKGRIRKEDGPSGWRRCLQGHRMAIVGFEDRVGGQRRLVVAERVGGLALKEEPRPQDTRAPGAAGDHAADARNWSWREEDNTLRTRLQDSASVNLTLSEQQRYPPSGGVGLRVLALYGWYPEEGATDELMFPRGAEISEAADINEDWYWGCYAGAKGLFPGNHGRVVRRVE